MEYGNIELINGKKVRASEPVIISASRATDIPAYYSEWLLNSLKRGYVSRINPFNGKKYYISFKKTRLIVFWSKNPEPILNKLDKIEEMGYKYYFLFTLNDYPKSLEPNIPDLDKRIKTFQKLSEKIGKEKVIWRFDPLILTDKIDVKNLALRVESVAEKLRNYTEKLVISFADIDKYRKVKNNLKRADIQYKRFDKGKMINFVKLISPLSVKCNINITTCAESIDLSKFGINHNRCIDDKLIENLFYDDKYLMKFLYGNNYKRWYKSINKEKIKKRKLKDSGQRKECRCIESKDIGRYNTCISLCSYCYANSSNRQVMDHYNNHNPEAEHI